MRIFLLSSLLLALPLVAEAAPDAAQTAAICQTRTTCKIDKTYDAGKSPDGVPLTVAEVSLGFADKPKDEDDGCRSGNGDKNGGTEYWLLAGTTSPKQLLALCNDGYGSSGVGEDEITIGPDRLAHWQTGGSSWRWAGTTTYSLSPWRPLTERSCSYHNSSETSGTSTDYDYATMVIRSISEDRTTHPDPGIGCADWPKDSVAFAPRLAPGVVGAYNIVGPVLGDNPKIPTGTAIGNCVPTMTTAGVNGFIVYGKPAPTDQAAEIKVMAIGLKSLLIQVFDPLAASQPASANASWINLPHVELWIGLNQENVRTSLPLNQLQQIGVDLEGRVHRGVGKAGPLPTIQRWQARDADGRPVTVLRLDWTDDYALLNGLAVVYSQAEAGKQTRLVSTTGIANNRPLYVPSIAQLSDESPEKKLGRCSVHGGRLERSGW